MNGQSGKGVDGRNGRAVGDEFSVDGRIFVSLRNRFGLVFGVAVDFTVSLLSGTIDGRALECVCCSTNFAGSKSMALNSSGSGTA